MKEINLSIKINRIIFCSICIFILQLYSLAWGNSTDQQKINSAINIIKDNGFKAEIATLQGNNYTHKPVKIIFKDLSEVDFSYSKFYAITATDDREDLYILINNNLLDSDARCLSCLILHELTHAKRNIPDSVPEEVTAHQRETMLYMRLLDEDETLQYKTDRLTQRLNKLKKLYDDAVKAYISSNTAYVNYLKIKE